MASVRKYSIHGPYGNMIYESGRLVTGFLQHSLAQTTMQPFLSLFHYSFFQVPRLATRHWGTKKKQILTVSLMSRESFKRFFCMSLSRNKLINLTTALKLVSVHNQKLLC